MQDGELFTGEGGADQLPRRWGTFVQHLRVANDSDVPIETVALTDTDSYRGLWRVANHYTGFARVSYDVDFSFATRPWPPTNEKAGFFDGRALYVVTKPLFLGSRSALPVHLEIDAARDQSVATAWNPTPGASTTFEVRDIDDLQSNTIVVGDFGRAEVQRGDFHFTLALIGAMRRDASLASSVLLGFARSYSALFPKTPSSRFMMTMFYGASDDGESFSHSAAFVTAKPITRDNVILWGNTQGHELMHFWIGSQIAGADHNATAWLEEGFTEYYANLALRREHMVSPAVFQRKMENNLGKYIYFRTQPQFDTVSLVVAGNRKTTWRFGVYNGGWAAAFGLDMTIRDRTAGRRTLDDVMRLMFERFGQSRKPYALSDVVAASSEVAGSDMSDFFVRYVQGRELMPIESWLRRLGYEPLTQDYAEELYLVPGAVTPLRRAWLSTSSKP